MQLQKRELALPALSAPEIRPAERDIATLRRHVISGDWTPINNSTCTLTDLGCNFSDESYLSQAFFNLLVLFLAI